MDVYYTAAGYKTHYTQDRTKSLCGRLVTNVAGATLDMCKTCENRAAKINDYNDRTAYAARAAETQDDVMQAAPVEPTPAVGAPADAVAVAMPELVPVPLILTRTPIAVVGNAPGGPNHLYGTSKGDGTGPTVADIMARAERQGATNLHAYASDTCPEITGHYDTFRPVCVNHPNAEGAWWGKVNDRPFYFCEACNNVPLTDRPEAVERESRLREAMPLFNAMMGTRRTDSRGYVYVVDKIKFSPVRHRHTACVSVSGTVVEEYSDAADGPDRARTYGAYAGELFYGMPERETFDYATPAAPTCEHGNDGSMECAPCIAWDDAPAQTHMITFVGNDETMCGEPVRQNMGTLRVSVDPSDATCPTCIGQERALAALDNAPEPSDDECHRIALEAALTAAESHMETPLYRAPAPAREAHTLTLTQSAPGRVLVSVGDKSKEFIDNRAIKLHAAMWAHSVGFQPVKGRGFKWQRSGKIMSAPARLI